MKYLFTNNPDDGCHEINGVYGRPVHQSQIPKLLRMGWKSNASDLPQAEEVKKEETKVEVKDKATQRKELAISLNVPIVDEDGEPLHYKLIDSAIKEAQEANEHNES